MPGAVFMQALGSSNDHDLGLFSVGQGAAPSPAGRRAVGLYHLAWEIETLDDVRAWPASCSSGVLWWAPTTTAPPRRRTPATPDDLEFEVSWLLRVAPLDDQAVAAKSSIRPAWADAS